jgi:hypothetical protein
VKKSVSWRILKGQISIPMIEVSQRLRMMQI